MMSSCDPTISAGLNLFGVEFLSTIASSVVNYSRTVPEAYWPNHATTTVTNASFCNVTISYTHPGWNDVVTTQIYLPIDSWNGRLMGFGGDGLSAGLDAYVAIGMGGAAGTGYMAVTTNGGHNSSTDVDWSLKSPGNTDWYNLDDYGSRSLDEMTTIAKSLGKSFYGKKPGYSYFTGCSQGGRQGLALAQKYPTAYDGIAASAPAMFYSQFVVGNYWSQFVMNELHEYPLNCEMDAISAAIVTACDADDGVVDGILADPDACKFDPYSVVGANIDNCSDTGSSATVSLAAAKVASAALDGPKDLNGSSLWHGITKGTQYGGGLGLVGNVCSSNGTCVAAPKYLYTSFFTHFLRRDPTYDPAAMTHEDYVSMFKQGIREYRSSIGTQEPDLSEFKRHGGKLLAFHGLADPIISAKTSRLYYEQVMAEVPDIHGFYRYFEAPGLGHCYGGAMFGGSGYYPSTLFDGLIQWVENGTAPESLPAHAVANAKLPDNSTRLLCPYPKYADFVGSDPGSVASFECVERAR